MDLSFYIALVQAIVLGTIGIVAIAASIKITKAVVCKIKAIKNVQHLAKG